MNNTDSWCIYCANRKLCEDKDCKICFEKSFASHKKSKNWSTANKITPRQVIKYSHKKYIFDCNECNQDIILSISHIMRNVWCSCSKNKTELKLFKWLEENFTNIKIQRQVKFDWCKNDKTKRYLPFDFVINSIIIELDGPQHFEQVSNWKSHDLTQDSDIYKMQCAFTQNYNVIRIIQIDVLQDTNNWEINLKTSINKIMENTQINKPILEYIGENYSNNIKYKNYIKTL